LLRFARHNDLCEKGARFGSILLEHVIEGRPIAPA
jgi:hypothetical protein